MSCKSSSKETQEEEKVYVAVGNDIQDGYKTLAWTLKKWNSQQISIVLLHVTYNISKDFVYTPFGKLPASSVSEEKLEVLKKYEQEKTDKFLSKYIAFCGKVKAEILKVEKYDEHIHKLIVDLIARLKIGKLVIGMTFMKSSSWKSKSAISGSFYVHQYKPNFCEVYIICGGKLVMLKGKDEGLMEDDEGIMVAKLREKPSFKNLWGKIFSENLHSRIQRCSSHSSTPSSNQDSPKKQWEDQVLELENYFQHLLSLNLDEEMNLLQTNPDPAQPDSPDQNTNSSMVLQDGEGKMEAVQCKIDEAHETIRLKREEAEANAGRRAKAEWAIQLCNSRAEELETRIKEEVSQHLEIKKILDNEKEQVHEVIRDVEESKNRVNSLMELQAELSNKLQISSMARAHCEAQLEKAIVTRTEMVGEIEELRRQRDVLRRRVEFCKDKEALGGAVARLSETLSCSYREYAAEDIRLATDDFSERLRLKSGGDWLNVYRGRINHSTVAIKMLNPVTRALSQEDFQAKVKLLNDIRHPHLVAMMGFCFDPQAPCMLFEYMHNGSLREILFSSQSQRKRRSLVLGWHDRIRIAREICSGLVYLHAAQPKPIVHGQLTTSNILLDRNLVAKISGFGLKPTQPVDQVDVRSDIGAFGAVLMHMLTGRNWGGLIEDRQSLVQVLDDRAGKWPLDLAMELAGISLKCLSVCRDTDLEIATVTVMEEMNELKKKADDIMAAGGFEVVNSGNVNENTNTNMEDSSDVPGVFLCPIFKEVMKNPYVAADGFSYELEAIQEWLKMGRDTSPMTNLGLKHKLLTPNHTLRSLIQEWQTKGSNLPSP